MVLLTNPGMVDPVSPLIVTPDTSDCQGNRALFRDARKGRFLGRRVPSGFGAAPHKAFNGQTALSEAAMSRMGYPGLPGYMGMPRRTGNRWFPPAVYVRGGMGTFAAHNA